MDADHGKRKAIDSPGTKMDEATSRVNKARKLDHQPEIAQSMISVASMADSQDKIDEAQRNKTPMSINNEIRGSELTQKLVAMWVGGTSQTHKSLLTHDVKASMALRESKQKCIEAENLLLRMQEKIESTENVVSNLTEALEQEEKTKTELMDKINTTADVVATITEHINYITDTLGRCQRHKDHLSNLYDSIILRQREELGRINNRETELQSEIAILKEHTKETRISYEHKLNESDAKLSKVVSQYEVLQNELKALDKEKEEIARTLSIKETLNLDLKKKISEYEMEVQNFTDQLGKVTANLESMKNEESKLKNDLLSKNRELQKMADDLESAIAKRNEQSAEISSMKDTKIELEEKLKSEINERESLSKSLNEIKKLNKELSQEVEKLKTETSEGIKEIKRRLEIAESEKNRFSEILEEQKIIIDEMEEKHKNTIKSHVEKYESCLAEMKALEAHHQSEISRVSITSSTAVSNANAEKFRLEEKLETLRQEKEEREVELRQVEDLLIKHTNSELQLKRKFEQCERESAALAASAVSAAEYRRKQDAANKEKSRKIADLEKELLKLQFDQKKICPTDVDESTGFGDTQHPGKERPARKTTAAAVYKKSILRRSSKSRKARSSPASPALPSSNKNMNFLHIDSSSDTSPVKLTSTSNIAAFINTEDTNDEISGIRKNSFQLLQASQMPSQITNSQNQASQNKFFKSRNYSSQFK